MEGIIFDMDGVLVETEGYHYKAWAKTFQTVGITLTMELYERYCQAQGRPNAIRNMMGKDVSEDRIAKLSDRKEEVYMHLLKEEGIRMYEDAKRLIDRLYRAGIKMAVASSSRNAAFVLEQTGRLSMFDVIVTGLDVRHNKPNPEIFLLAAERLSIPKEQLVIVEDSEAGIHAAIRSSIPVKVIWRHETPMVLTEEMKMASHLEVVTSLDKIRR